ncbi:hypothetical protein PXQ65_004201 [Vibrio parahaemolyticus]|nr:hypothetical protein [Vibrio parahaemolyticus]EKN4564886.1 hypothetical protein [Vibrio parahaemolyticus]ELJ1804401.1 hypothetical protein [Vibrio parahaemolyticus]
MGDTKNIKLGTCKITFAGEDLGLTLGGVELSVETTTHETKVDQFGETTVNEIITGRNVTVTAPLAETTLENLVKVMPGATLITDSTDSSKKRVEVKTGVGESLLDVAQELILHPIALPDSDVSEDVVIPKAATAGAMNFAYQLDQERVFNSQFKGYPDPSTGVIMHFGDKTASA